MLENAIWQLWTSIYCNVADLLCLLQSDLHSAHIHGPVRRGSSPHDTQKFSVLFLPVRIYQPKVSQCVMADDLSLFYSKNWPLAWWGARASYGCQVWESHRVFGLSDCDSSCCETAVAQGNCTGLLLLHNW